MKLTVIMLSLDACVCVCVCVCVRVCVCVCVLRACVTNPTCIIMLCVSYSVMFAPDNEGWHGDVLGQLPDLSVPLSCL